MRVGSYIVLIVSLPILALGQSEILDRADFEKVIEELLPLQEYDVDYSDFYDRLFTLYSAPIDLNTAERSELQSLYILTDEQISGILEYRKAYGPIRSIYELNTINGLDKVTIDRLVIFIRIGEENEGGILKSMKNPAIHELFVRYQQVLEKRKGYAKSDSLDNGKAPGRYVGGPARLYSRYLYAKPGSYSIGFTTEKDPGEKLIWDPGTKRYGMDYYSFHGMIENALIFTKIVVGDFSMDFGQGLVFGSGIRLGKGIDPVTTIRRNSMGLRPYRSVYERKDFSGLAFSAKISRINLNVFISNVNRDAKIYNLDTVQNDPFTTNFNNVGLHRTPNEIELKHNIADQSYGGNVNLKLFRDKLEMGINAVANQLSVPILPSLDKYKIHQFRGSSNGNASSYVNYYFKKGHLFSEFAVSRGGGVAHSSGLIVSLSSHVQAAIHYRNYGTNFHSFSGRAFGENTSISNERGLFWGIRVRPVKKLLLTGYFDYFNFPWLKYRIDAPSDGVDFMGSLTYNANARTIVRIQYRNKSISVNDQLVMQPIPDILNKNTSRFVFDLRHQIDPNFIYKIWLQGNHVTVGNDQHKGFMIAQDLTYSYKKWSFSGRFSLFDADDFNSRMYIYERDLLYVYSIPSFYNKGVRCYVLGKYTINNKLVIWLKYARTNYYDIESIGTGLESIVGNSKSNLGMQLRIRF